MIIGKFSSFFTGTPKCASVQLLESIVRRIFIDFRKLFQIGCMFAGKSFLPSNEVGPGQVQVVPGVSRFRYVCHRSARSIDPPDHIWPDSGSIFTRVIQNFKLGISVQYLWVLLIFQRFGHKNVRVSSRKAYARELQSGYPKVECDTK